MSKVIYGHVTSPSDLKKIFAKIRAQIRKAKSRARLTELVKRAQYLVTLSGGWDSTPSPAWSELVSKYPSLPKLAKSEYLKTCALANMVAKRHGWKADYGP